MHTRNISFFLRRPKHSCRQKQITWENTDTNTCPLFHAHFLNFTLTHSCAHTLSKSSHKSEGVWSTTPGRGSRRGWVIYWLLIFQVVLTWHWSLPSLNDNICLPAGKMSNINKRYIFETKLPQWVAKGCLSSQNNNNNSNTAHAFDYDFPPVPTKEKKKKIRIRFAGFGMYSKIIIATVNILLVGVIWDIKAINHCLSVLISVREISEIGNHKSWLRDSTLRLHSSWRYRFIVLKTHSGEWRMRASRRLPTLNLLQGRLAPPTDRRRGWEVAGMIGYRQAAPTPDPCPLLTLQTPVCILLQNGVCVWRGAGGET